jgi:hypothetical protein
MTREVLLKVRDVAQRVAKETVVLRENGNLNDNDFKQS